MYGWWTDETAKMRLFCFHDKNGSKDGKLTNLQTLYTWQNLEPEGQGRKNENIKGAPVFFNKKDLKKCIKIFLFYFWSYVPNFQKTEPL